MWTIDVSTPKHLSLGSFLFSLEHHLLNYDLWQFATFHPMRNEVLLLRFDRLLLCRKHDVGDYKIVYICTLFPAFQLLNIKGVPTSIFNAMFTAVNPWYQHERIV